MRNATIAAALAAAVLLAAPAARADENPLEKKGGFRDVKLGIDLDALKKLDPSATVTETRKKAPFTFYKRSSDRMTLFGATLHSIEYGFKDGKLGAIILKTEPYKQLGGAIDMYHELPEVKRITAGFDDELGAARADVGEDKAKRIRAFAEDSWKASDLKIIAYQSDAIVALVLPVRVNLTYPGQFEVRVVVLYLAKGVELGEI